MKKAVILYYSIHHGNTKKVVEAVSEQLSVDLVRIPTHEPVNLEGYDLVGFASGVYMSEFGKPIQRFVQENGDLSGKACFTLYTCGAPKGEYAVAFEDLLRAKGANIVGGWHCRGFDTFGPFKLIGGLAKGRPNEADLAGAVAFVEKLLKD
jgi:flavodoxin